jgi:DHA1 family multidrug resistance protein-like MFS transporter
MVSDLIRESFIGQFVYFASRRRVFQYAEEKPGFVVPERYTTREKSRSRDGLSSPAAHARRSEAATLVGDPNTGSDVEKAKSSKKQGVDAQTDGPRSEEDEEKWRNTVDWYGPDDPEHPMNVSRLLPSSNSLS